MPTKTAQFTPGPWKAMPDRSRNMFAWSVEGAKGVVPTIARLSLIDACEEIEGNAHLIAAAPVMYADLRIIRDYLYKLYDDGNMQAGEYAASLDTTLAQAEGRQA